MSEAFEGKRLSTAELEGLSGGVTVAGNHSMTVSGLSPSTAHPINLSSAPVAHGTVTLSGDLHLQLPANSVGPDSPTVQVMHFSSQEGQFTHITPTVVGVNESGGSSSGPSSNFTPAFNTGFQNSAAKLRPAWCGVILISASHVTAVQAPAWRPDAGDDRAEPRG